MTFAWPLALLALLLVPAIFGIAWLVRRRRRRNAVRVSSVALVRQAVPQRSAWHRRVPAAVWALGLVVLCVGAARPQVQVPVATDATTVMLAFDVSSSMCSTDVDPNRLTVAKEAAVEFVEVQAGARIGLVAFSSSAAVVVSPTTDTDELVNAIEDLTTSRGTAIGQAILTSIDAIAEVDDSIAGTGVEVEQDAESDSGEEGEEGEEDYAAAAIVVLTDGANSAGVEPSVAAEEAAARGIRVYTIGFGTTTASPGVCSSSEVSGSGGAMGGGGMGGGAQSQSIDEAALQEVADVTGGEYYRAENADQLSSALTELPNVVTQVYEDEDVSARFALAGGLLVAVALALSAWWGRPRGATPPALRVRRRSG